MNCKISLSVEDREGKSKMATKKTKSAWDIVEIVSLSNRPTALDYIENIFEEFIELHGDRNSKDDKAIVCGLAKLNRKCFYDCCRTKGKKY